MGRMPRLVELGKKDRRLGEPSEVSSEEIEALELDPRVELIRQLIPLELAEVGRMLEEEVEQLAWRRHLSQRVKMMPDPHPGAVIEASVLQTAAPPLPRHRSFRK